MAKKTLFVVYVPQAGAPENMPAEFPVPGWGKIHLSPYPQATELAQNLAEHLLSRCSNRVFLANKGEIFKLSDKFVKEMAEKAEKGENPEKHFLSSSRKKVDESMVVFPGSESEDQSVAEPVAPIPSVDIPVPENSKLGDEKSSKKPKKETEK